MTYVPQHCTAAAHCVSDHVRYNYYPEATKGVNKSQQSGVCARPKMATYFLSRWLASLSLSIECLSVRLSGAMRYCIFLTYPHSSYLFLTYPQKSWTT